jgi:hypothetical protein
MTWAMHPHTGLVGFAAVAVAVGLAGAGLSGLEPLAQADGDRAALRRALPRVKDLPPGFAPAGDLAHWGTIYTAGGRPALRVDDGDHYHGYDGPGVWAKEPKGFRPQGVVYGVDGDVVTSAGYLLRQADLVAGKSFHGLTLRGLDFPAARSLTIDLVAGPTPQANLYLFRWHFLPGPGPVASMRRLGDLPPLALLPPRFALYACEAYPNAFCPGMGRHRRDPNNPPGRLPASTGDDGVTYGEAAGKLIFIEYILGQPELAAGASWPAMPLDGVPIPPIDNVHVLHFGSPGVTTGRYTVHMYFIPEDTYLGWTSEPPAL